jgi:AcrR family transcriptional regulator
MAERSRRVSRPSGDDRQEAILVTTEALLQTREFDSLSIDELAKGAGISRPTFYFYFASKEAVLLALLDRVIRQVEESVERLPREFAADPAAAWRQSIAAFVDGFSEHRAVGTAAMAVRSRNAEVHDLWSRSMLSWVDYTAEVIEAERARGAAPAGIRARDLAASLNLMNERVLLAAATGEHPAVTAGAELDVLVAVWLRSIYGIIPTSN